MTDEQFMQQALLEAKKAAERDEVPVGAVIVMHIVLLLAATTKWKCSTTLPPTPKLLP